ncbi:MAG: thiamine pyrophosphate-dependent enzyme [Sulfuritalea sp.]|nr:thiamine pyrophosphate-dependent enzyme [Sulfuritalea sp.]
MAKKANASSAGDFFGPAKLDAKAVGKLAERIIEQARALPAGVNLLLGGSPLALSIAESSAEELSGLIPRERWLTAAAVVEIMGRLGAELKKRDFMLDELIDELVRLPAFCSAAGEAWKTLAALAQKGLPLSGLPADPAGADQALLKVSQSVHIALEYLLGNLQKVATLLRCLGVRDEAINASSLFHNFMSGFVEMDLAQARLAPVRKLIDRATDLAAQGCELRVFSGGDFNLAVAHMDAADLEALAEETGAGYNVSDETFRRFLDALVSREETRLRAAPQLTLLELLQAFKFPEAERELVSRPGEVRGDDPTRWQETPLGRALTLLKPSLNWLAVSAGITIAGNLEEARQDAALRETLKELRAATEGYTVTVDSGRGERRSAQRLGELSEDDLLFDLYCLAVMEKRPFGEVLETARSALALIQALENPDPRVNLNDIVSARLAGDTLSDILNSQGLAMYNFSLAEALGKLRALAGKVSFTVNDERGNAVGLDRVSLDEFRRAMLEMGRHHRVDSTPGRVLALIRDKIVPEIKRLPKAVIAPGTHDLARVLELAGAGIPARYPLRRKWTRVNLDPLATMGSGLEPGIRNCLGCPVNSLYGLVTKTACATGFEEIITYEATGCFEVYSGIWPYTGKKNPTLHGVFGGAPSELLGGLAAKKARLKYAHKINGAEGAAMRAELKRTLHLGWGGDGATFDIGFGNLSGLFSRLQKLSQDKFDDELKQRALYVCYDNEGYQNTGNQYSAASSPGGHTTTNPQGIDKPMGNELRKKHIVEIMADHGVSIAARMNLHRQEHITRVVSRALEDGVDGAFLHFLQPCTTGWKFTADSMTYDLSYLSEEGGLFPPVTFEHGVPYLEMYPTPRNPGDTFLKLQARFKHLLGGGAGDRKHIQRVIDYYADEWIRNLQLCGFEGEIPYADRLGYLEEEHRKPRINIPG